MRHEDFPEWAVFDSHGNEAARIVAPLQNNVSYGELLPST
jgi:hypothetical protein